MNARSVKSLIDPAKGTISRDLFVSKELYRRELEQVFARTWLFIGHESQIPNPNDYFVSRMGEESVIMTRDRQGEIHVLLNTCMHRGMKVCRYDEGNTPVFSCPYHGWSYSTDGNLISVPGELIGVPQFATAYHGELKKEEWGLISVPKMHVYKGSVWACWDENAPDWDEYIGEIRPFLDAIFDSSAGEESGVEVVGGVQKWLIPSNWKFAAENFVGDFYHGRTTHRSADLPGALRTMESGRVRETQPDTSGGVHFAFPEGHGTKSWGPEDWERSLSVSPGAYDPTSEIGAYLLKSHEAREQRLGGRGVVRPGGAPISIFPNMSCLGYCLAVWHPVGPVMTEAWRWYFVDKNAPESLKRIWRHYRMAYSGPTGMVESDDMENWNYASDASEGTVARQYDYHYGQGLGHEGRHDSMPSAFVTPVYSSEQNQRAFYMRWAELMDAADWKDISE